MYFVIVGYIKLFIRGEGGVFQSNSVVLVRYRPTEYSLLRGNHFVITIHENLTLLRVNDIVEL